jgi:hypothetical protein
MEHWVQVLPHGVLLEVRYEDVVADLERQARWIVAHCGLAWDAACLGFHGSPRPVRTASAAQARRPLYYKFGRSLEGLRPIAQPADGGAWRRPIRHYHSGSVTVSKQARCLRSPVR